MADQGEASQTLRCPNCGVLLPSDGGEQFFCESCGSPLPGGMERPRLPRGGLELRDWRKEVAELPDWLQEATEGDRREAPTSVRGIELRPATAPSPGREVPERGASAGISALLVVAILLGLLCLGGGILLAVLLS